ncbi:unnamed protein product, partial [Owenia fusiformis]
QDTEAMLYALDLVNNDQDILPNIKLGTVIFDGCRSPERTVRLSKAIINKEFDDIVSMNHESKLSGVIGAPTSDASLQLAELLSVHKVTQISPSSSSSRLDDIIKYPHFLRTVGSDKSQAKALVDIIKNFGWSYVHAVFSDNAYGVSGMREFIRIATNEGICVATQIKMEEYFAKNETVMSNILHFYFPGNFNKSRVVVMFTTDTMTRAILETKQITSIGNDLVWLAADYWGTQKHIVDGVKEIASGAITLDFNLPEYPALMDHFRTLRPETNLRNPWFKEYWQHIFRCYISDDSAKQYSNPCSISFTLENKVIPLSTKAVYVVDSVMAYARGLDNLIKTYCEFENFCP